MDIKEKICSVCGKPFKFTSHYNKCNHCRYEESKLKKPVPTYFPPYGGMKHDKDGKPICHICGYSYHNLGNHITRSHHISSADYKKRFGLKPITKLTSFDYQRNRISNILNNPDAIKTVKENATTKDKEWVFKIRCKYCRYYSASKRVCNFYNKLIKLIPDCEAK